MSRVASRPDKDRYLQSLRGLAIAAVVLIHCLPSGEAATVWLRPWLNFSVALFLFLSGALTNRAQVEGDVHVFWKRRILHTLPPFLVWSSIYLVVFGAVTPKGLLGALFLGNASAQMYYLLVYMQLVLLTPLFFRLLDRHRVALYMVTPLVLAVRVTVSALGLPATWSFPPFCGSWLAFYLTGLDWAGGGLASSYGFPAWSVASGPRAGRPGRPALLWPLLVRSGELRPRHDAAQARNASVLDARLPVADVGERPREGGARGVVALEAG